MSIICNCKKQKKIKIKRKKERRKAGKKTGRVCVFVGERVWWGRGSDRQRKLKMGCRCGNEHIFGCG